MESEHAAQVKVTAACTSKSVNLVSSPLQQFKTPSVAVGSDSKRKSRNEGYCFKLKLRKSNRDAYSEFSWKELVKDVQTKESQNKTAQGKSLLDPYASDDEDDLKAMAARFEAKYGTNDDERKNEKRRKRKAEDYIDRGAGYDESDSFIDNSQIYDEIVPEDIQTVYGGFYINSGRLDFKEADVSDCDIDEELEDNRKSKGLQPKPQSSQATNSKDSKDVNPVKLMKKAVKTTKSRSSSSSPEKVLISSNGPKSPKLDTSRSSSPSHPIKLRTATATSSDISSDSNSSSTSSSSSSSDSDDESDKKEITIKTESGPTVQSCASTNPILKPSSLTSSAQIQLTSQRSLKLKNVPLNPKLHGGTTPQCSSSPSASPKVPQALKTPGLTASGEAQDISKPKVVIAASIPSTHASKTPLISTTSVQRPVILSSPNSSSQPKNQVQNQRSSVNSKVRIRKQRVSDRQPPVLASPPPKRVTPVATPPNNHSSVTGDSSTSKANAGRLVQSSSPKSQTPVSHDIKNPKPKRPRSTSNASTANANPSHVSTQMTPEQQLQHAVQQFQLAQFQQALGIPHFFPPGALSHGTSNVLSKFLPKELQQSKKVSTTLPASLSKGLNADAANLLKNLASFQTQLSSSIVSSAESKKTRTITVSPSIPVCSSTGSPKSSTPPSGNSRLSTPSPINIPRVNIPSSITITTSNTNNVRNSSTNPHQRASSPVTTTPLAPTMTIIPTALSHLQNAASTSSSASGSNTKTYTPFDMKALLSKPFNNGSRN